MEIPGPTARAEAICLDCRTILRRGEPCGGIRPHRTTSLETATERLALLREVWGSAARRHEITRAVRRAGVGGGLVAAALVTFRSLGLGGGYVGFRHAKMLAAAAGAALALLLLGAVVDPLWRWLQRRRHLLPFGARTAPTASPHLDSYDGVVQTRGPTDRAPVSKRPCLAYAITLCAERSANRSPVMSRQAATVGFDVVASDGSVVRVPAGRIGFHPEPGVGLKISGADAAARSEAMFQRRARVASDDFPLVRGDHGWEALLVPGDRVRIVSRFERREDTSAERARPRDPAATVMMAIEPAFVEKIDRG